MQQDATKFGSEIVNAQWHSTEEENHTDAPYAGFPVETFAVTMEMVFVGKQHEFSNTIF
jgi:hypothetical protein